MTALNACIEHWSNATISKERLPIEGVRRIIGSKVIGKEMVDVTQSDYIIMLVFIVESQIHIGRQEKLK